MIFVPLPRFVLPTLEPLFWPERSSVDKGFSNIQDTSRLKVQSKGLQNSLQHSRSNPLLKPAMAGLVGRIAGSGTSAHGAPVRKIHRIPFSTARRSLHGRPRPSLRGIGCEIKLSRISHWALVRSRSLLGIIFREVNISRLV